MPKINYENVIRYIDNTMVPYLKRNFSLMLLGDEIAGKSHVCEKHVALDEGKLENRLSELNMASSFTDYDSAEEYIKRMLFDEGIQCDIAEWLFMKKEEMLEVSLFTEDDPVEGVTGYGMKKGSDRVLSAFNVRLVIKRDESELGWHIVTAYPIDFMPVD